MPILLAICVLCASCAKNSDQETLAKFKAEILANPESFAKSENNLFQHHETNKSEWIDEQGNVVKSYTYSKRSLGALSYMPIASFFLPRDYKNYEIITTSRNSSIIDVREFYSLITLKSEAHCHEAVFTCIKSIK